MRVGEWKTGDRETQKIIDGSSFEIFESKDEMHLYLTRYVEKRKDSYEDYPSPPGLRSGVHLSLPNGQAEDNLLRFALQLHNARWSALSNRISGDIFDVSGWRIPVFPVDFQKSRILGYCADGSDVAIDRVDQSGIAAFVVAKSTTIWNRYPMSIDRRTI
ncbi:unnamed protein product [Nesidiocoris tenuis]|uniref:Uncharacterized protein n=1 Tax=Nesidiocoris tenuis TaxID=355587 RepID=A0A6H5G7E4_9HEMI|nr:unnamed protein product [Nesidiocoris tenuis]